ncbi:CocE/NonD family hydrolase [Streptomyces sp. NPDC014889]|uniref:CocE/NonD family hydrolase n=1 Tax=Streptomyces sp. NPDC014889 TaxID=3364928 RepID=UPI0036FC0BBF
MRLHLTGARTAATAGPEGGALSPRPDTGPASAVWDHDPADLVPATDGDWWRPLLALADERTVERRPDVLTFTATVARRPLQLAGPVRMVLPVTSTSAVSHLVVKLCDVAPDGTSRRILEAPYRMEAGGPSWHRALVLLGDTGHRLETGHRLRVQVASSCFPLHLPHTAGPGHPWRVRHTASAAHRGC